MTIARLNLCCPFCRQSMVFLSAPSAPDRFVCGRYWCSCGFRFLVSRPRYNRADRLDTLSPIPEFESVRLDKRGFPSDYEARLMVMRQWKQATWADPVLTHADRRGRDRRGVPHERYSRILEFPVRLRWLPARMAE